ncbi:WbqC family protein [Altibacter sp. HG106]|uniref:WbqC family protein n=1 Tax=Altibacter sp. HG106 TaxID=3023937 RepID=UPI0023503B1E|nr:WbqC family protein [Altibacter sp. HG106]MDC7995544.1 WbqC family protein [Altibacter sp. HG106]
MEIVVQPSYFPCIAQMAACAQATTVIFEVCDNYQKQTYRNRARIAHANGRLQLNVPIQHSRDGRRQKTAEVAPDNNFPWQSQHWKSLQSAYRTSPFFEFYEDDLAPLFKKRVNKLLSHHLEIYEVLCELIGMEGSYEQTTTYQKEIEPVDLRHWVRGKKERSYALAPYTQVLEEKHGYLENLSVLDLLFNEGPNALSYLERQQLSWA